MRAGRPTKYKRSYCQLVVELMEQGASKIECCAKMGINFQTFLNWQQSHSEFLESVEIGTLRSQAWWERLGRLNLENKKFNYHGYGFQMKNRFNWSDKHQVSGNAQQVPANIKVEFVNADGV